VFHLVINATRKYSPMPVGGCLTIVRWHYSVLGFFFLLWNLPKSRGWVCPCIHALTSECIKCFLPHSRPSINFSASNYVRIFCYGHGRMQSQLVCNGCRNVLLYPRGATNVCCAICITITPVPPPGIFLLLNVLLF